jgi:hypothetical protein
MSGEEVVDDMTTYCKISLNEHNEESKPSEIRLNG